MGRSLNIPLFVCLVSVSCLTDRKICIYGYCAILYFVLSYVGNFNMDNGLSTGLIVVI
jgi:hypothetical protein